MYGIDLQVEVALWHPTKRPDPISPVCVHVRVRLACVCIFTLAAIDDPWPTFMGN